ncbi:MAG: kynureninase [Fimbriimonadaceae bacterium]|nr:kynureninase [Fimbriimonadaceae bacterium]
MSQWIERARELDAQDPIAAFRDAFVIEDPNLIYLKGNSLGRMPKPAAERVRRTTEEQWAGRLVRAWNEGWYELASGIGDKISQIIGAEPGEVILSDSTTINLYKLAHAVLQANPGKTKVVTDTLNFPSDFYALQSVAKQFGGEVVVVSSEDGLTVTPEAIEAALDAETALLSLSLVCFRSSWLHDGERLTKAAHGVGAMALWDLSHAAGSVAVALRHWNADLAIGCTYKYLSGGPGAPAFLYVRKDLQESLVQPLWGWFGQERPFEFDLEYSPASGLAKFLVGTPPILSMVPIECGVDLLIDAGMGSVRAKSTALTDFFLQIFDAELSPLGFRLQSPHEAQRRGAHVSMGHDEAYRISRALIEKMNVVPDFRAPDNIRFGFAPLYTRFEDVALACERLHHVMVERVYESIPAERLTVT